VRDDREHQQQLRVALAAYEMADRLAGPPEFADLAVVEEWTG